MHANQLTLALATPVARSAPVIDQAAWLDVSDLAKGVGFETQTAISVALADALAPTANETDADYDQRLYDALWLAHLQFTLNGSQPSTFNFSFSRGQTNNKDVEETCLRLHVESVNQTTFLGLPEDF